MKKGAIIKSDEFHCNHCDNFISYEHGGVLCTNCKSLFCCEDECSIVPVEGCSMQIPKCRNCGLTEEDIKKFIYDNKHIYSKSKPLEAIYSDVTVLFNSTAA